MTPNRSAIGPAATNVQFAVMHLAEKQSSVSVEDVAALVGRSKVTVYRHLVHLRELGLVTWEHGKHGTLRPTVELRAVA